MSPNTCHPSTRPIHRGKVGLAGQAKAEGDGSHHGLLAWWEPGYLVLREECLGSQRCAFLYGERIPRHPFSVREVCVLWPASPWVVCVHAVAVRGFGLGD
jgi:hypothetical protein